MSIYASIENRERGLLFVLNDGLPGSRVIVIRQRTVSHIDVFIRRLRTG